VSAAPPAPPRDLLAPSRRRHTARWVAVAVAAVLVAVAIVVATRPSSQATAGSSPLLGQQAPALVGRSFDGQPVSLAADRGDWVVVNFFASWCPPCQAEEPDLVHFAFTASERHAPVKVLGVDIDDSRSAAEQFLADWHPSWPTVPDADGAIAGDFGVASPPTTFLVDPAGKVTAIYTGPLTYAQLLGMVPGLAPS
jgi:cytochrome c biogenesis protein CcmG/thiol:disulfide interchange protein DsbE